LKVYICKASKPNLFLFSRSQNIISELKIPFSEHTLGSPLTYPKAAAYLDIDNEEYVDWRTLNKLKN